MAMQSVVVSDYAAFIEGFEERNAEIRRLRDHLTTVSAILNDSARVGGFPHTLIHEARGYLRENGF